MTDERPIPAASMAALERLGMKYRAEVHQLAILTVRSLGLSEDDNWDVNFDTGVMTREIPDITPARSDAA